MAVQFELSFFQRVFYFCLANLREKFTSPEDNCLDLASNKHYRTNQLLLYVQKNNTTADNGFFPFFISPKSGNEKQHDNCY
jgi:hypothetical protein